MYQPEGEGRARARRIISGAGYKCGGHFAKGGGIRADEAQDKLEITSAVHQHEGNMHPGMKKTRLGLAYGGVASGGAPPARSDRPSRGKKGGAGKTHVNILIAPQGDKAGTEGPPPPGLAPPGMPPMGPPPGGPAPIPGPPPRPNPPMASPTGNSPMGVGAPLGGMPPMRKSGGRIARKSGGRTRLQDGGIPDEEMEGMQMGGMPPAPPMPNIAGGPQSQLTGTAPLPPARGMGLRRAQGLGPPGWPGSPAPAGGPDIMSMPQAQRMAAMGYGNGAPSAQQMQSMANMNGQTPIANNVPTGPAPSFMPPPPPNPGAKRGGRITHKAGGRTGYSPPDMEAGAGSGAGRLDKIGK